MRAPKLRAEGLREAARLFGLDASRLTLVNAGVNEVYKAPGAYLKLGPPEHFDSAKQLGATSFLAHAFARGAPVAEPLFSVNGNLIETVSQDGEAWQATLAREVPGQRLDPLNLTQAQARAWGHALGQLHEAARGFAPPPGALIKDFGAMWHALEPHFAAHEPTLLPIYRALSDWQQTLPRDDGSFGVTHGDTRAGNALWDGGRVWLIDFDEPNTHFFGGDLARPLLETGSARRNALRPYLLAGYRGARPLNDCWESQLPHFERQRAVIMLGWSLEEGPLSGSAPAASAVNSSDGRAFGPWLRDRLLAGDL